MNIQDVIKCFKSQLAKEENIISWYEERIKESEKRCHDLRQQILCIENSLLEKKQANDAKIVEQSE